MTTPTDPQAERTSALVPSQRAREAAADMEYWHSTVDAAIRQGEADRIKEVQAFARFEQETAALAKMEIDQLRDRVEELKSEAEVFDEEHADQNRMVDRIAKLIGLPHDQELDTTAFEFWFSALALPPQEAREGFVSVPVEPTKAMIDAAMSTPGMEAVNDMVHLQAARGYPLPASAFPDNVAPLGQAWSAMLAAAPSPRSPAGEGEKRYREWCASDPDHKPDGTRESLIVCAGMLEEYGPECFPANEHGQIHFARSMMDSVAAEIRAYLGKEPK